jgi:hypothetical protein
MHTVYMDNYINFFCVYDGFLKYFEISFFSDSVSRRWQECEVKFIKIINFAKYRLFSFPK